MALHWNHDDELQVIRWDDNSINPEDRNTTTKVHDMRLVYGNETALAVSWRRPGYHSHPHIHDFEQLNYIAEGEMWFFVGERSYQVVAGDFLRIPRNAIHWSWVKTEEPCLAFEVFGPPPPPPAMKGLGQGLFDETESPRMRESLGAFFIDPSLHGLDIEAIEAGAPANRSDSKSE